MSYDHCNQSPTLPTRDELLRLARGHIGKPDFPETAALTSADLPSGGLFQLAGALWQACGMSDTRSCPRASEHTLGSFVDAIRRAAEIAD